MTSRIWLGRLSRRHWCRLSGSAFASAALQAGPQAAAAADGVESLKPAYQYAFPLYEMARLRYRLQFAPPPQRRLPSNRFYHSRNLATPSSRTVTAPNADTLYSLAIVDLAESPVQVRVPDMDDRYYSIAFIDMYTNDFRYIGSRVTGTRAGTHAIVSAPTPVFLLLLRILVRDADDLETVHRLQDGFELTASRAPAQAPPSSPLPESGERFVAVVNEALAQNPPPDDDAPILRRIAAVGIGPGAAPLSSDLRQRWNTNFFELQRELVTSLRLGKIVNGWEYPPDDIGRFGTDYRTRAQVALSGLLANVREEALSITAVTDAAGLRLDNRSAYRLRLPPRMPVAAFWSLSMYEVEKDGRLYFREDALHRYVIGDRSPGLRRNADGSLDLFIQRQAPAAGRESNWLPIPPAPFLPVLRNYVPTPDLLDGRFRYAALERIG